MSKQKIERPLVLQYFYNPLNVEERKACAEMFGLKLSARKVPRVHGVGSELLSGESHRPDVTDVKADNHCYFHALSYLITGMKGNHVAIRKKLCDYIAQHCNWATIHQHTEGRYADGDDYMEKSDLRKKGWGSWVELFATSQFLGQDVIAFTADNAWYAHCTTGHSNIRSERALYVANFGGNHWQPIIGLK